SLATVQSGLLWRDPCIDATLADNYRVGDYNVDYHGQAAQLAHQSQAQQHYDAPSHHHHHHTHLPQHGRPLQHPGAPSPVLQEAPQHPHNGVTPAHHPAMPHHHHQPHPAQILLDPAQMGHHRLEAAHFETPNSVVSPIYHNIPTPTSQTHSHHPSTGIKRPRPDELDIHAHGMAHLDQSGLGGMHHVSPGGGHYEPTGTPTTAMGPGPPTHHHHRLPDSEPSPKLMRRDDGGAPSVVGQVGMPEPAPRPKGPKLKFTREDDQLLIDLKEQKNLTWKQIADFFPGRSSGTLQVRYCTKLKAKTKQWSDEMDMKLRTVLEDYENEKWRIVASKLGTGFTPAACRDRADQLWGDAPADFEASSPTQDVSAADTSEVIYAQQPQ
ncbi:unnamed protein product, partial [Clonostachys byssicola]